MLMRASFFNLRRISLIVLIAILFITMVFDKPIQAGAALPEIKIGLFFNQGSNIVQISSGKYYLYNLTTGAKVSPDNQPLLEGDQVKFDFASGNLISVSIKKGSNEWVGPVGAFTGPVELRADLSSGSTLLKVNTKRYRQDIIIRVNSQKTGLTIINELPLEEYLYGVVPREMSASWPGEALKAQAVAARTFAVKRFGSRAGEGFDLYSDQRDQAYGGYDGEDTRSNKAVNDTIGKVIVDANNDIIREALYHSNSGGHTEDSENVWSAVPYLRGKADPYSLNSSAGWTANWNYISDINTIRTKVDPNFNAIESLKLEKYSSGRVRNVIITDLNGNNTVRTGSAFGNMFNPGFYTYLGVNQFMGRMFDFSTNATVSIINAEGKVTTLHGGGNSLKVINGANQVTGVNGTDLSYTVLGGSTQKTIAKAPSGQVIIEGHGWGHGVGMSQWGAYEMALQGFKYDDILKFYYSGVKIQ